MQSQTIARNPIDPEIVGLATEHGNDPEAVLSVLQSLHARHGALGQDAIRDVARALRIPASHAYGVATFYSMLATPVQPERTVRVCDGPACWLRGAAGARHTVDAEAGPDLHVERTSCLGLCDCAPAALVGEQQVGPVEGGAWRDARKPAPTYTERRPGELRVLLARAGKIDPDQLETALAQGAYRGLGKALAEPCDNVIAALDAAGLQGRGGAGFPAGRKMRFVAQAPRTPKYIVCNADESEPLIFKDRVLIDNDPQQLLEGMALAGYGSGAHTGFIYIRGEYAAQAARLERAIHQAEAAGWLGDNIQGTGFSFHIHVHRGAGAYICGEETALLSSLGGDRGEPRVRPPYPPTFGYRGYPTLVNNVETYSSMPAIIANGAEWYRGLTTAAAPGTKMYMLLGHVNRPGLFEAPFGLTLRRIIDIYGGGMRPGSTFRLALTGGAAGTIVHEALLDTPIDYSSSGKGISLGAGAFMVCDQTVSPVALLRELLYFFESESCGKCTPCRVGTHEARVILDRLVAGQGRTGDVAELKRLSDLLFNASFCGLGQAVPIPMRSAMTNFASDFAAAEH
jgi:NADH:ubiquinone oxidoreductase subunit F (NADH-binding)/NADH:ubiquinone oxidoreductase subunit E